MRKQPELETDEERALRQEREQKLRSQHASAEERELDAAVRQSIERHGA